MLDACALSISTASVTFAIAEHYSPPLSRPRICSAPFSLFITDIDSHVSSSLLQEFNTLQKSAAILDQLCHRTLSSSVTVNVDADSVDHYLLAISALSQYYADPAKSAVLQHMLDGLIQLMEQQ